MGVFQIVQLAGALVLCTVFGTLALIRLAVGFMMAPLTFFKVVRRGYPDILRDDWNHDFVSLKSGVKLHYVSEGDRSKPLMLMLHGFPAFWFSWRHQIKEFAKSYYVVALDMRGYNESDKPEGVDAYAMEHLVNDVKEFVASIGYKTCTLVAHDWGGVVGWSILAEHPELFDKGILLNIGHPLAMQRLVHSSPKQIFMSWYIFFFQLPYLPEILVGSCDFKMFDQMFGAGRNNKQWANNTPFSREEVDAYKWAFGHKGALTSAIHYYRSAFRTRFTQDVKALEKNSRVPVPLLIIWGTADLALSTDLAQLSAEYCDNVQIKYLEGASHFVHEDLPDEVNRAMWRYLKEDN